MVDAAPRDASWWPHPDVYSFKVVHVSTADSFAVCDRRVLLCDESPRWSDAATVPEDIRCRRRACALAYREAETPDQPNGSDQ